MYLPEICFSSLHRTLHPQENWETYSYKLYCEPKTFWEKLISSVFTCLQFALPMNIVFEWVNREPSVEICYTSIMIFCYKKLKQELLWTCVKKICTNFLSKKWMCRGSLPLRWLPMGWKWGMSSAVEKESLHLSYSK